MNANAGGVANALGNVFRTQRVAIGQIAYNSGQQLSLDIPRGLLLKSLKIRLSGTLTVGVGITSWNSETPLGLLQRIELAADGRKPFVSTDGRMLYRKNQLDRGWVGELVSLSAVGAGTYSFVGYVSIDEEAVRTVLPILSYQDTRLFDSLKLAITWAPSTVLGVLGGGTITINAGTVVDVIGEYTTEGFEQVQFNKLLIQDEIPVTATSSSLRLAVPRNGLLKSILFRTDVDSNVVDTLINNVTLRSENNVYHMDHLVWSTEQASNAAEYQLQTGTLASRVSGYMYHELIEDFELHTGLDTSALNTLDLVFDVTAVAGTTRLIRVLYEFFEPAAR